MRPGAEDGFQSHDCKLIVRRPRLVLVEKQSIDLIWEVTEASQNLRHQTQEEGTFSDVGASQDVAPHQFVLDHKQFVIVAIEPEQCIEKVGIIGPKHVHKTLRLKPVVKWVCTAQTVEGVVGVSHVPHASGATDKIQEGLPAVCSDPTVSGKIQSPQP